MAYPDHISDHGGKEHVIQLDVLILQHIFQAATGTVLGNDADVGWLGARSDKCTNVVVSQVLQLWGRGKLHYRGNVRLTLLSHVILC